MERAYRQSGERVAILVDEYDKPLLQAIGNEDLQCEYRNTLKPFYGVLKTMDGCIRFAILTGVTKFGKVSVFSDLNNLEDLSMWNEYVGLCGISNREIHANLEEELHEFAEAQGMTYDKLCSENDKHYTKPFESDGRELFKVGVNFSAKTRNIEKWIVES